MRLGMLVINTTTPEQGQRKFAETLLRFCNSTVVLVKAMQLKITTFQGLLASSIFRINMPLLAEARYFCMSSCSSPV